MYRITTGIHVHFAHHVRGHGGPCISLHGHTWRFDATVQALELDQTGFVVDFDELQSRVLDPVHRLLDHSLALGDSSFRDVEEPLALVGEKLVASRLETLGNLGECPTTLAAPLAGAKSVLCGGIKLAVFPFVPTSERLAEWFFHVVASAVEDARVQVHSARVFEALVPVESVAEYLR